MGSAAAVLSWQPWPRGSCREGHVDWMAVWSRRGPRIGRGVTRYRLGRRAPRSEHHDGRSQLERETIGECTRDSMSHKRTNADRVGNIQFGYRLGADGKHVEPDPAEQAVPG